MMNDAVSGGEAHLNRRVSPFKPHPSFLPLLLRVCALSHRRAIGSEPKSTFPSRVSFHNNDAETDAEVTELVELRLVQLAVHRSQHGSMAPTPAEAVVRPLAPFKLLRVDGVKSRRRWSGSEFDQKLEEA